MPSTVVRERSERNTEAPRCEKRPEKREKILYNSNICHGAFLCPLCRRGRGTGLTFVKPLSQLLQATFSGLCKASNLGHSRRVPTASNSIIRQWHAFLFAVTGPSSLVPEELRRVWAHSLLYGWGSPLKPKILCIFKPR